MADLRPAEVSRALRALSSAYVERRDRLGRGAALDGAGKRAAFALFYGPLHFLATREIVRGLAVADPAPGVITDLGCGTGAAGAAWALEASGRPRVVGMDRHPWAVEEARWSYRTLGLDGDARRGDIVRARPVSRGAAVVAAYTMNELDDAARAVVLPQLLGASGRGSCVLIIEPIGSVVGPWWQTWRTAFQQAGGRADEWRFALTLPSLVARLDRAAGLDHRELTARSLYLPRPLDRSRATKEPRSTT